MYTRDENAGVIGDIRTAIIRMASNEATKQAVPSATFASLSLFSDTQGVCKQLIVSLCRSIAEIKVLKGHEDEIPVIN